MSQFQRQIPNILTLIRIPLALISAYYAFWLNASSLSVSLTLFLIASGTDFLDGYLARKWNIVSRFGKFVDPVADKILILSILFVFTYHGIIHPILTIIIAFREIALTVIRLILLSRKVVLASRFSGKVKTFSQVIVLVIIYLTLIFNHSLVQTIGVEWLNNTILLLIIWIVSITIYSGAEFFLWNRKAIMSLT